MKCAPPNDFNLRSRAGDDESWEQAQQYEVAYQLARIANALESMLMSLTPGADT